MTFTPTPDHARAALMLGVNLVLLVAVPANAADSSAWDGSQRAAIRLIGGPKSGETIRAGVELRLSPGWKTYWRYPGDSGIPPRFDFSKSRNVKSVTVLWPAPQRLTDDSGVTIGYKHDVVYPLEVVPQDAAKPVGLSLSIDYAICEKLCVPADGKAELNLSAKSGEHDGKLAQAVALVPKPAAMGADGALSIRTAKREGKRVVVDVAASSAVELFAEGPTPDWALPVPAAVDGAPAGQQRFAFEIDGLPPNTTADGAMLKLTAVAGEHAIEVPYRLDTSN